MNDDQPFFCPWCGYGPQENPTESCSGPSCDITLGSVSDFEPDEATELSESDRDYLTEREDMTVGKTYTNIHRRHLITLLDTGDEVTLTTDRKGTPSYTLTVTENFLEEVRAVDDAGNSYRLTAIHQMHPGCDGPYPWLRTAEADVSKGEVKEITLISRKQQ